MNLKSCTCTSMLGESVTLEWSCVLDRLLKSSCLLPRKETGCMCKFCQESKKDHNINVFVLSLLWMSVLKEECCLACRLGSCRRWNYTALVWILTSTDDVAKRADKWDSEVFTVCESLGEMICWFQGLDSVKSEWFNWGVLKFANFDCLSCWQANNSLTLRMEAR